MTAGQAAFNFFINLETQLAREAKTFAMLFYWGSDKANTCDNFGSVHIILYF